MLQLVWLLIGNPEKISMEKKIGSNRETVSSLVLDSLVGNCWQANLEVAGSSADLVYFS